MSDTADQEELDGRIAIIGMSCRAPGANSVAEFWENIRQGRESLTELTDDELVAAGVPESLIRNPDYVKAGMFLQDPGGFDAGFFGFSPRDAQILDPQHRHFLEVCWEALEDGGYNPFEYEGPIGVFAGSGHNSYMPFNLLSNADLVEEVGLFLMRHTGNDKDFLTTRVSYNFNLRGPSLNIQTACSTSLVAIHTAVQSLINFECDMALAGGISILLPRNHGYLHEDGGIASKDGHCRAFDASSTGTIISSGAGVVLLKRLDEAIRDRDQIHGVVIGSAVNNDGSVKVNYLAPSVDGQAAAISEAIEISGVDPDSVEFIECHGTGTKIGDPIEVAALTQAYGRDNPRRGYCAIGSVKSNIGHTDTAAGVLGLIKAVMSMKSAEIAPTVHFSRPNPEIDFEDSPFYVNNRLRAWPSSVPRRSAVSSLGVGGTNAHVVLEEAPLRESGEAIQDDWYLLPLSARTPSALARQMDRMKAYLEQYPETALRDAQFTLLRGRQAMQHRAYATVEGVADALTLLGDPKSDRWNRTTAPDADAGVVFMYAGGGAQYPGMGRDLYASQTVFREALDECASILARYVDFSLLDLLYPENEGLETATREMERPSRSLPCLFAMQYAQTQLWLSLGVKPVALIGHSMGENTALCIAGGISLEEGISLVAMRGVLQEKAPEGGMVSVMASPEELEGHLFGDLSIAVINSPGMCVASGPIDQIDRLQELLDQKEIQNVRIRINVAAHSPLLDPILPEFQAHLDTFGFKNPEIPIASTFSGTWLTADQACSSSYWTDQLRNPVKFSDAARVLLEHNEDNAFLEVGPSNVLSSLVRQHPEAKGRRIINSTRHRGDDSNDNAFMLEAMGALWAAAAKIDWDKFFADKKPKRIGLPTYPFEHREYWIEPGKNVLGTSTLSKDRNPPGRWFFQPSWKSASDLSGKEIEVPDETGVLLIGGPGPVSAMFEEQFRNAGGNVEAVDHWQDRDELQSTLEKAASRYPRGLVLIHLAAATPPELSRTGLAVSYFSLWDVAKAVAELHETKVRLSVVAANSLQSYPGELVPGAMSSSMSAMLRVIPSEISHCSTRYIDTDLERLQGQPLLEFSIRTIAAEAVENFGLEVSGAPLTTAEDYRRSGVMCFRQGHRFEEEFAPIDSAALASDVPRHLNGKHVIISGGLGGLGLAAARHFAELGCSHITLIGRSGLPDRKEWKSHCNGDTRLARRIAAIRELESAGVDVQIEVADIVDEGQVATAVEHAIEVNGRIAGVLHTAGILDDQLLQLKSRGAASAVLEPKILGAVNLVQAVKGEPLEFILFYSSVSAYLGTLGQTDYAAANAFLDSYARELRANGLPAVSVNWPIWKDVGMAADLAAGRKSKGAGFSDFSPHVRNGVYQQCLGTADWRMNEHRTADGRAVLPGTGLIQLAYSAYQALAGDGVGDALTIEDMSLFAPLAIRDGDQIVAAVKMAGTAGQSEFEILSAESPDAATADEWSGEHVQGRIVGAIGALPESVDIEQITRGMKPASDLPALSDSPFMKFGQRWDCLRKSWIGSNELFGRMALSDAFAKDLATNPLHPALLDNAVAGLQTVYFSRINSEEFLVPMSYQSIEVYRALPKEIYSHVRFVDSENDDDRVFDVDVYDLVGQPLLAVRQFRMKKMDRASLDLSNAQPSGEGLDLDFTNGISPEDGIKVLDVVLGQPVHSQVIVSPVDFRYVLNESCVASNASDEAVELSEVGELSSEFVAPETEVQKIVADIWKKGLGLDRIGIHDNFFELGGHSLLLTQLASRMKKELNASPKMSLLFDKPTISAWSVLVESADQAHGEDAQLKQPIRRVSRERFRTI